MTTRAPGFATVALLSLLTSGCDKASAAAPEAIPPASTAPAAAPSPSAPRPAVTEISMLYSSEKKEWVEAILANNPEKALSNFSGIQNQDFHNAPCGEGQ